MTALLCYLIKQPTWGNCTVPLHLQPEKCELSWRSLKMPPVERGSAAIQNATWENCQMIQFHLGHIPLWIITQDMSWTSSELTNGVGILALASILSWWCVCCDHNCANTFARRGNLWLFQLLSVRVNVEAINEGTWIHDAPNRSKPVSAWSHLLGGCFYLLLQSRRKIMQLHKIYKNIQLNESKWHQLGFVVVWMESSVDSVDGAN